MKTKLQITISFILFSFSLIYTQTLPDSVSGQERPILDTLPPAQDTLSFILDSIQRSMQARRVDTLPSASSFTPVNDLSGIKISEEAVDEQVEYTAQDSMFFDVKNKQIHLYGQAVVKYLTMTIEAGYIIIDWNDNTITAEGRKVLGQTIGEPKFTEKNQTFTSSRMRYNFKTRKGIIYDAVSQQEGMQVHGRKAKYISSGDSLTNDVIYNQGAIFTTCTHTEPHFGIRSKKQKVVPEKVAVVGPSNLEVMGVPTPLILPFGFFPLKQGRRTGLIFPRGYEFSEAYGFGLNKVGWYFPISDHWDLQLTGDIYLKGTFRIHANSRYAKRYKYRGDLRLDIAYLREENQGVPEYNPSFGIRWSHNQDSKAHPSRSFRASLNLQGNNYQKSNEYDAQSALQSSLSSNISMNWRSVGPFSISTSFNHSQNTRTRDVRIQFPNLSVQSQTMYPFKSKKRKDSKKWYEQVSLRYSGEFRNEISATDTTLFSSKTLDDARYGMRHDLSSSVNFNILKYFNLQPKVNYKEVWYLKTIEKVFDSDFEVIADTSFNPSDPNDFTVSLDTIVEGLQTIDNFGFKAFREFDVGVSLRTKLYRTFQFKKGWLRGFRHVVTPSISFSFSPDYSDPDFGYYRMVQTDAEGTAFQTYSIFDGGIFGRPSGSGKRMSLSYGISNDFEAKYYSKKDSTEKKLNLFRGFSIRGSYNFAADSLNWSTVRMGGSSSFFNGMTTATISLTFDPYAPNDTGLGRINKFWHEETGKYLRFVDASLNVNTSLTIKRIRDMFKGINSNALPGGPASTNVGERAKQDGQKKQDDLLSLFENTSIRHSIRINWQPDTTILSANSISISAGNIPITDHWNVRIGNIGYDFKNKRLTYPDFSFSRDLHCWEMGVSWRPVISTYSFYLRVKPGRLDFISIPYGKGPQDAFGRSFGF